MCTLPVQRLERNLILIRSTPVDGVRVALDLHTSLTSERLFYDCQRHPTEECAGWQGDLLTKPIDGFQRHTPRLSE